MRFVFLFLSLVVISSESFAGHCLYEEEPRSSIYKRIYDEASFIGKIKIEQTIHLDDNPKIIGGVEYNRRHKVFIIQPYKGNILMPIEVYSSFLDHQRPSPPWFGDVGKIYERGLKKIEGEYVYYLTCQRPVFEEQMHELRVKAIETSLYIEDYKKPCEAKGGIFTNQSQKSFFDCFIPAEDEGKSCSDNSECKGLCLADVSDEEVKKHCHRFSEESDKRFLCSYITHGDGIATQSGKCSKFSNMQGNFKTVVSGKTKYINTETEGKN